MPCHLFQLLTRNPLCKTSFLFLVWYQCGVIILSLIFEIKQFYFIQPYCMPCCMSVLQCLIVTHKHTHKTYIYIYSGVIQSTVSCIYGVMNSLDLTYNLGSRVSSYVGISGMYKSLFISSWINCWKLQTHEVLLIYCI